MTLTSFSYTTISHRKRERDAIQSDIDTFLAHGGKVQYLTPGEASNLTEKEVKELRRKDALRRRNITPREGA